MKQTLALLVELAELAADRDQERLSALDAEIKELRDKIEILKNRSGNGEWNICDFNQTAWTAAVQNRIRNLNLESSELLSMREALLRRFRKSKGRALVLAQLAAHDQTS